MKYKSKGIHRVNSYLCWRFQTNRASVPSAWNTIAMRSGALRSDRRCQRLRPDKRTPRAPPNLAFRSRTPLPPRWRTGWCHLFKSKDIRTYGYQKNREFETKTIIIFLVLFFYYFGMWTHLSWRFWCASSSSFLTWICNRDLAFRSVPCSLDFFLRNRWSPRRLPLPVRIQSEDVLLQLVPICKNRIIISYNNHFIINDHFIII